MLLHGLFRLCLTCLILAISMPPKRSTTWKNGWLRDKDCNGDLFSSWCEEDKKDYTKANCKVCNKNISLTSHGIQTLKSHAEGDKHKKR